MNEMSVNDSEISMRKLTCLHCQFNSFMYFIVCRNM